MWLDYIYLLVRKMLKINSKFFGGLKTEFWTEKGNISLDLRAVAPQ